MYKSIALSVVDKALTEARETFLSKVFWFAREYGLDWDNPVVIDGKPVAVSFVDADGQIALRLKWERRKDGKLSSVEVLDADGTIFEL